ncbi:Uu.00g146390.m01.CDS01 [Anthostomella pinea]|uniref:Uu.00g146390.m01.CDS01 n=1 Tax=Anthostomella pinea TaxID=933095 RepID=A0AAI8VS45_9PEZI|nr:Uu.00g146390.m01.CDS01 [Anthostomella pinea]
MPGKLTQKVLGHLGVSHDHSGSGSVSGWNVASHHDVCSSSKSESDIKDGKGRRSTKRTTGCNERGEIYYAEQDHQGNVINKFSCHWQTYNTNTQKWDSSYCICAEQDPDQSDRYQQKHHEKLSRTKAGIASGSTKWNSGLKATHLRTTTCFNHYDTHYVVHDRWNTLLAPAVSIEALLDLASQGKIQQLKTLLDSLSTRYSRSCDVRYIQQLLRSVREKRQRELQEAADEDGGVSLLPKTPENKKKIPRIRTAEEFHEINRRLAADIASEIHHPITEQDVIYNTPRFERERKITDRDKMFSNPAKHLAVERAILKVKDEVFRQEVFQAIDNKASGSGE